MESATGEPEMLMQNVAANVSDLNSSSNLTTNTKLINTCEPVPNPRKIRVDFADFGKLVRNQNIDLTAEQKKVLDLTLSGESVLMYGVPSCGRTTVIVQAATKIAQQVRRKQRLSTGEWLLPILVIAPDRDRAAKLKTLISKTDPHLGNTVKVATTAGVAQKILLKAAQISRIQGRRILPAPNLLSGAMHDAWIKELLLSYADEVISPLWQSVDIHCGEFRGELRDLLTRCQEIGLDSAGLEQLATQEQKTEWLDVARIYKKYELKLQSENYTYLDHAGMVNRAVLALQNWEPLVLDPKVLPWYSTILVDDYQDMTLGSARLLGALSSAEEHGQDKRANLVISTNPDFSTQGFRGGSAEISALALQPSASQSLAEIGRFGISHKVALTKSFETAQPLQDICQAVAQSLPSGPLSWRETKTINKLPPDRFQCFSTAEDERRFLANEIRKLHLKIEVPWSEMAVITRSATYAEEIRSGLARLGVPVEGRSTPVLLRNVPAVLPLLTAARFLLSEQQGKDGNEYLAYLVRSYLCDLSPFDLNFLERNKKENGNEEDVNPDITEKTLALSSDLDSGLESFTVAEETEKPLASQGNQGSKENQRNQEKEEGAEAQGEGKENNVKKLMAEKIRVSLSWPSLPSDMQLRLKRLVDVLEAGRQALTKNQSAQEVLWELWSGAQVAEKWRNTALSNGYQAVVAEQNLDDINAIFQSAEICAQRDIVSLPEFIEFQDSQDLPSDSVAPVGERNDAVKVLTAAQAAGNRWEVVFVAEIEYDIWPNTKVRDGILSTNHLAQIAIGREAVGERRTHSQRRQEIIEDELRMFLSALARARSLLFITTVMEGDAGVSPFVDLVRDQTEQIVTTKVERLHTLSGLVARLRALGAQEAKTNEGDMQASNLLAFLADNQISLADPDNWGGLLAYSKVGSIMDPQQVVFSPSKVEAVIRCPLQFAWDQTLVSLPDNEAIKLGLLLHKVFEDFSGCVSCAAGELIERMLQAARNYLPEFGIADIEEFAAQRILEKIEQACNWMALFLVDRQREDIVILSEVAGSKVYELEACDPTEEPAVEIAAGQEETEPKLSNLSDLDEIPKVKLVGRIDRVEIANDQARLVDLKTGKYKPTKEEAQRHTQINLYKYMWDTGAFYAQYKRAIYKQPRKTQLSLDRSKDPEVIPKITEALLFYPLVEGKSIETKTVSVGIEEDIFSLLKSAYEKVTQYPIAAILEARNCERCDFRTICPLQPEGQEISW